MKALAYVLLAVVPTLVAATITIMVIHVLHELALMLQ